MQGNVSVNKNKHDIEDRVVSKLNIGCGNNKIPGYWNIDSHADNAPDQVVDVVKDLPFPANSISEILFFHSIEHIEEKYHDLILARFHMVLIPDGELYISYPEFLKVAENYVVNYKGMREFWKNTIYGLQRFPGDFHVSLMDTDFFVQKLQDCGFKDIEYHEEGDESYNTIVKCKKGDLPIGYEDLINREILEDF